MNNKLTALIAHHLEISPAEATSLITNCKSALLYHDPSLHEEILDSMLSLPSDFAPLILLYDPPVDSSITAQLVSDLTNRQIVDPEFDYINYIFTLEDTNHENNL